MNCYHMTSLDRLNSIIKSGLVPRNEDNSKLVNDEKTKVFFSEGFEGVIALYVDFNIVYENIKNKKISISNKEIEKRVLGSKNLADYLKEGVYLQFDGTNIKNERNFENGCTDETIFPEKLNVCILKNKYDNSVIFSRFEVIKFMMSKVKPVDIKYYGVSYDNSPSFDEATKRIQEKVEKYYVNHKDEIEEYNSGKYLLEYIPLVRFITEYVR